MALSYSDVSSVTVNYISKTFVDNYYKISPVFVKAFKGGEMTKDYDGGLQIQAPFQYAPLKAGPFAAGGVFDISYIETQTAMVFNPKWYYSSVTIQGTQLPLNRGEEAVMNFIEPKMVNGEQALAQALIQDFYRDGQGTVSPIISLDGILAGYDDGTTYPTYGGIARASIGTGASNGINGYYLNVGGPFSLPTLQTAYGQATFGTNQPNLISTTQSIYNSFWAKMLPMQRTYKEDPELQSAGFHSFMFNGMAVVVDQYCPSGDMFGMNTAFLDVYISTEERFAFGFTGFKELPNSVDMAGQNLYGGNIVVTAPRLGFILTGITS